MAPSRAVLRWDTVARPALSSDRRAWSRPGLSCPPTRERRPVPRYPPRARARPALSLARRLNGRESNRTEETKRWALADCDRAPNRAPCGRPVRRRFRCSALDLSFLERRTDFVGAASSAPYCWRRPSAPYRWRRIVGAVSTRRCRSRRRCPSPSRRTSPSREGHLLLEKDITPSSARAASNGMFGPSTSVMHPVGCCAITHGHGVPPLHRSSYS